MLSFLPLELLEGRTSSSLHRSLPPSRGRRAHFSPTRARGGLGGRSEQCKAPHGYFWLTRTDGRTDGRRRGGDGSLARTTRARARSVQALSRQRSACAFLLGCPARPPPLPRCRCGGACCAAAARSPPSLQSRSGRRGKRYFTLLLLVENEKTVDRAARVEETRNQLMMIVA